MKRKTFPALFTCLSAFILCFGTTHAEENAGTTSTADQTDSVETQVQDAATRPPRTARLLERLLKMDDAELAELRLTIERIEALTPEEKEAMRKRLKTLRKNEPERIEHMRERLSHIPEAEKEAMRKRWKQMEPAERRNHLERLRAMSPEERAKTLREEGILPGRVEQ